MHGKLLFMIPVYVRSPEDHSKDFHDKFQEFLSRKRKQYGDLFDTIIVQKRLTFELEFQSHWYSWDYTQIIKIIEIRHEKTTLKAYLYSVDAKRFRPLMNKKIFKHIGKLSDIGILNSHLDNETIKDNIYRLIDELKRRFKRYYVDDSFIQNILPLIDFRKLR